MRDDSSSSEIDLLMPNDGVSDGPSSGVPLHGLNTPLRGRRLLDDAPPRLRSSRDAHSLTRASISIRHSSILVLNSTGVDTRFKDWMNVFTSITSSAHGVDDDDVVTSGSRGDARVGRLSGLQAGVFSRQEWLIASVTWEDVTSLG